MNDAERRAIAGPGGLTEKQVRWIVGEAFERYSQRLIDTDFSVADCARQVAREMRPEPSSPYHPLPTHLPDSVVEVLQALDSVFTVDQIARFLVLDSEIVCDAMDYLD